MEIEKVLPKKEESEYTFRADGQGGWGQVRVIAKKRGSGQDKVLYSFSVGGHGGCCGIVTFVGQGFQKTEIESLNEIDFSSFLDTIEEFAKAKTRVSGAVQVEDICYAPKYDRTLFPERVSKGLQERGWNITNWFYNKAHNPPNLVRALTFIPKQNEYVK